MTTHTRNDLSLDSVLEKGFADMKKTEEEIKLEVQPSQETKMDPQPQQPIQYNQKINAVEDRPTFVVASTKKEAIKKEDEEVKLPAKSDVAPALGDDFDVEW